MYAISYRFVLIHPNEANQKEFVRCWSGITDFFRTNAGALGARLHKGEDGAFYAYAQWPDKATFEAAGNILPTEDFVKLRMAWAELCEPSEILWVGEVSEDLLER